MPDNSQMIANVASGPTVFWCKGCDVQASTEKPTDLLPPGWGWVWAPDDEASPRGSLGPFYACPECKDDD